MDVDTVGTRETLNKIKSKKSNQVIMRIALHLFYKEMLHLL